MIAYGKLFRSAVNRMKWFPFRSRPYENIRKTKFTFVYDHVDTRRRILRYGVVR